MSKQWPWVAPYAFGILAALLAGPLLSSLARLESVRIPLTQLTGPDAIRLTAEAVALALLLSSAVSAHHHLSDNGRASSFLREIVLPLATLLVVIFGGKALRAFGLPIVEQIGSSRFLWGYAIALIGAGFWLTAAWLRHLDLLRNALSPPQPANTRSAHHQPENVRADLEDNHEAPARTRDNLPTVMANDAPAATLGRYKILKELGGGAMGLVYLGKDPTIQRFVAIKTMRLNESGDEQKLQEIKVRFFREAESAGRLSHPNIVTIYDAGEQDGLGFIAMEFIEGQSLKQWARQPNLLTAADVVELLASVAEALDYAHQQGVVHRDIKPANIMVTKDRLVKVMDFGIAKTASSSKTHTDIVLGTPTYMSPEQIAGKKVDGRSDVFSLGIVLFELLTGQPPFAADNLPALLFAIAHQPHPELASLRQDLPPIFQEVLDRALQKELPQRYRRAGELAQDLRACLQNLAA
jgi:eukaryotic-like serine/threonine-protein kinase